MWGSRRARPPAFPRSGAARAPARAAPCLAAPGHLTKPLVALQFSDIGSRLVEPMISPDGHRVEQVLVQRSLSRPPKPYLRVRRGTYFVADCATVEEVAQLVDLASCEPVV